MDGREFYQQIDKHPHLEWLGVKDDYEDLGEVVIIADTANDRKYALTGRSILDTDWAQLEAVLTSQREALIMVGVSRIVGYFSRIKNWNRSKVAELRDRQKGDYTPPEPPKKKKVMVPGEVGRKSAGAEERTRTSTPVGGTGS